MSPALQARSPFGVVGWIERPLLITSQKGTELREPCVTFGTLLVIGTREYGKKHPDVYLKVCCPKLEAMTRPFHNFLVHSVYTH